MSIKPAIPIDDGKRCVLLFDPDASERSAFENLLCIDQNRNTVWTTKLPTDPDVFVEMVPMADAREGYGLDGECAM